MITIADLIRYRMRHERLVTRIAAPTLPTDMGEFRLYAYENLLDGQTHLASSTVTCRAGKRCSCGSTANA